MNFEQKVIKPVFVIGTNRAGKDLFMKLLAYNEDFAWLSNYNMRFPLNGFVSFFNRIIDLPVLNSQIKYMRGLPQISSAYRFWDERYNGFRRTIRDLEANDISELKIYDIYNAVSKVLQYQAKKRFIAQYSGWSRIRFIKKIFPDAIFIHIIRDGRAVANSLMNYEDWDIGYIPDEIENRFLKKFSNSKLGLAALTWKITVQNIYCNGQLLGNDDFMIVRYEDLIKDTETVVNRCFSFCGLNNKSKRYQKHFNTINIYNANEQTIRIPSWRDNLSSNQIDILESFLEKELKQYDYII